MSLNCPLVTTESDKIITYKNSIRIKLIKNETKKNGHLKCGYCKIVVWYGDELFVWLFESGIVTTDYIVVTINLDFMQLKFLSSSKDPFWLP